MKLKEWIFALAAVIWARLRGRPVRPAAHLDETSSSGRKHVSEPPAAGRLIPAGGPAKSSEYLVVGLLTLAALFAGGFIVTYAEFSPQRMPNWLLGVCTAGAFACVAVALAVFAHKLVVTEEIEEDYPQESPEEQREVAQLVTESGSRITRRKLLLGAAGTAGGAMGLAGATPLLSLGPLWDSTPLEDTPWHRGRRLAHMDGKPMRASDIEEASFYAAYAYGGDQDEIASLLVVLRLKPDELKLPRSRANWAPEGILAYSRICTHAGCAIELYRTPLFPPVEPKPALVCPCHYSTFDPATGATVTFGPAGRPLPQLPLMIDASGFLAAAGNFSGRVGPGWWGVREDPS